MRDRHSNYLGIDVGSASVRAGVFSDAGILLGAFSVPISIRRPEPGFAEQSSVEIWSACCTATREAVAKAGVSPQSVAAIGFDATCSLVVQDAGERPVSIAQDGEADRDIIMWMDHRAHRETEDINATGHEILMRTGGQISIEMQLPKLLWIKRNLSETWTRAAAFYDLPDWLVHRATGTSGRSLCSLVCKWTYLGEKGTGGEGWESGFFDAIGLGELAEQGFCRIGTQLKEPGQVAGYLTAAAADELDLPEGIPVAAGAIDAYAGALGSMHDTGGVEGELAEQMALIAGTSACHIISRPDSHNVAGVWGPYFSVLLPGQWTHEGGQSAAGAMIDRLLESDTSVESLRQAAVDKNTTIYHLLAERLETLSGELDVTFLTQDVHVQPDFLGNRSPLADAGRKGAIAGLTLEHGEEWLAVLYLASLQALAYGTRHIIESHLETGGSISTVTVSGGLARNSLYLQQHADALNLRILVPENPEPVLLGAAMLAAAAGGRAGSLLEVMRAMASPVSVIEPREGRFKVFHDSKYRVFRKMQEDFNSYRAVMKGEAK